MNNKGLWFMAFLLTIVPHVYAQQESPISSLNKLVDGWFIGIMDYIKEHQADMDVRKIATDILGSSEAVSGGLKEAEDDVALLKSTDEAIQIAIARFNTLLSFFDILKQALSTLKDGLAGQTGRLSEDTAFRVIRSLEQAWAKLKADQFPDPRAEELIQRLEKIVENAAGLDSKRPQLRAAEEEISQE